MASDFAPFPVDPFLTAIAIAYKNADMIADEVLPRVPVGAPAFKYKLYDLREGFTVPDTLVGRKSMPNEVEFTGTDTPDVVADYGLDDVIPQSDIDVAVAGYNPVARAVEGIASLIALGRESRVAGMVFNAANYKATTNKVKLEGGDQFSDYKSSDPLGLISEALDGCVVRPNIGIMGRRAYSILSRHPQMVKAMLGNSGDSGKVPIAVMAQLLELDAIFIGASRINTAKKGQTATLERCWGDHMAFIYRDRVADSRSGLTFGFTAQFGGKVAGQINEPKIGLRGSVRVRSGETIKELICANDLGCFIEDAVGATATPAV